MLEKVDRVGRADGIEHALRVLPKGLDPAMAGGTHQLFELAEGLFDGVEVRAVRRQIQHGCANGFDRLSHALHFVSREIVHDHDVTGHQGWREHLLAERREHIAVDRAIHRRRTANAPVIQRRDQRRGFPVAVWHLLDQTLSTRGAAAQSCHVRFGPRLIDKHKMTRIEP